MDWGVYLILIIFCAVYINIFTIAVLDPYLKKKKGIDAKYSKGGILLLIIMSIFLFLFFVFWKLGLFD